MGGLAGQKVQIIPSEFCPSDSVSAHLKVYLDSSEAQMPRLPIEPRKFKDIVGDMRHVVFSVIRDRPNPTSAGVNSLALGTGFFVRSDVFIACEHVFNPVQDRHQPGDSYRLIANLTGTSPKVHTVTTPQIGQELTLFPNLDLAILQFDAGQDQPYAAISYDDVHIGEEIGVVGYPLATLQTDANGNLVMDGLVYRTAKGPVTGRYTGTLSPAAPDLPIVEVNFMFVAGNSGGPVFEAETGRVVAMVQGFMWQPIAEQILQTKIQQLPLGMLQHYIAPVLAIYSWGIKLDGLRAALEGVGVAP